MFNFANLQTNILKRTRIKGSVIVGTVCFANRSVDWLAMFAETHEIPNTYFDLFYLLSVII